MTAAALSDGIVERVQGRAAALERIGASEDAADLRAILAALSPEAPAGAGEASTVPPPHWTDEDPYDRHPKSADEWNWRNDPPLQDGGLALAVRRLNFAADRADPRAPDQMALVLRKDLINVKHELIRQTAIAAAREMRL